MTGDQRLGCCLLQARAEHSGTQSQHQIPSIFGKTSAQQCSPLPRIAPCLDAIDTATLQTPIISKGIRPQGGCQTTSNQSRRFITMGGQLSNSSLPLPCPALPFFTVGSLSTHDQHAYLNNNNKKLQNIKRIYSYGAARSDLATYGRVKRWRDEWGRGVGLGGWGAN